MRSAAHPPRLIGPRELFASAPDATEWLSCQGLFYFMAKSSVISLILKGVDDGASAALGSVKTGMAGLGAAVGVAAGVAAAGAAAMGGGLAYSIGRAAEFEQAMANVGAISLASADDLARLESAALSAGSTTSFTATQAADGLAFLAMAGFDVDQSISALPAVLSAAAAGNMDLATTADIVSNVLGGFRIGAEEAGRVADVLALASANSNTSIEMLGQTMKFAAPTAANLGWSLEEVTASAGFLADAGIQSSLAGTHLRAVMGSLSTPTSIAAGAMEDLGIAVRDSDGEMLSFTDILAQFETALGDVSAEQRDFALNAIFGREAAGSFSILLGRGSEALGDYTEKLEGAGGAAEEMANRQLDTLQGQVTLLKSALDGAAVSIGTAFLPTLTDLAQAAIPMVEAGMARLQPIIEAIPGVISLVSDAFGGFIEAVQAGESPLSALGGLVETLALQFGASVETAEALRGGVATVTEAIGSVMGPVAEAVGSFVSWQDVLGAVGLVIASVAVPALISVVAAAAPVIAVAAALVGGVALLRNAWENDWGGIQGKTQSALEAVKGFISTGLAQIQQFWETHGEAIITAAQNAWDTVQSGIETVTAIIQGVIGLFQLAVEGDWYAFGETLRTAAETVWDAIKTIIGGAVDNIKAFFTETDWGAVGSAVIQGIANGISSAVGFVADAAKAAAQAALDAAKGFLGIQSPSVLAAQQIGKPFAQGIGLGAEDEMAATGQRLAGAIRQQMIPAAATAVAPGPSAGRSSVIVNHYYTVTINDQRSMMLFLDYLESVNGRIAYEAL